MESYTTRLREYADFARTKRIRNHIHDCIKPSATHPRAPMRRVPRNIFFRQPIKSVTVPMVGPKIATIMVDTDVAYPQYAR